MEFPTVLCCYQRLGANATQSSVVHSQPNPVHGHEIYYGIMLISVRLCALRRS